MATKSEWSDGYELFRKWTCPHEDANHRRGDWRVHRHLRSGFGDLVPCVRKYSMRIDYMDDFRDQPLDDNDLLNGPCPQVRCKWCEGYYDKPTSNAKDLDRFCSEYCEQQSDDAERIR